MKHTNGSMNRGGKVVNPVTHIVSNYALIGTKGVTRGSYARNIPDTEMGRAFRVALREKGVRV